MGLQQVHPQNHSVLIRVQPSGSGFVPGMVKAGCELPWPVTAGQHVFSQLEDICHGYDSTTSPALGGSDPVHTAGKTEMHHEQQYGPCRQLSVASLAAAESTVVSKRLCAGIVLWDWRLHWSQEPWPRSGERLL